MPRAWIAGLLVWLAAGAASPSWGAGGSARAAVDLTELSLEELLNLEVTVASRRPEPLAQTAAATAVLRAEDLRRCGVRSLPEALRLVPGMDVARIDANKWAVSARGFNSLWANKLLVQIDGRSIYSPLFSGVFWESQDVLLEDVQQVEVVRGPGAALWGANAVNGVINVVTKNARDTQGVWLQAGGGSHERRFGAARFGGRLGSTASYRLFAKHLDRAHSTGPDGVVRADGWHLTRGGGRVDWQASPRDAVVLAADVYGGRAGQSFVPVISISPPATGEVDYAARLSGGSLVGRWTRSLAGGSELAVQGYLDRFKRIDWPTSGSINTADLDLQHSVELGSRQELLWGLGYRVARDRFDSTLMLSLRPRSRILQMVSGFVQHESELVPSRLRLTLGTKLEHHSFTGFEVQPNLRLGWSPATNQLVWAALSRAVRTPSRADDGILSRPRVSPPGASGPGSPGVVVLMQGNPDFRSEVLWATEAGYRVSVGDRLTLEAAGFLHRYSRLRTMEPEPEYRQDSLVVLPLRLGNLLDGRSRGVELATAWQPAARWRVQTAYSYLHAELVARPASLDLASAAWSGDSPRHQLAVRSYLELPGRVELDALVRRVGRLSSMDIPAYLTADLRLGWRPTPRLEASLAGQHLLDSPHLEYISSSSTTLPAEVKAGIYGMLTWSLAP